MKGSEKAVIHVIKSITIIIIFVVSYPDLKKVIITGDNVVGFAFFTTLLFIVFDIVAILIYSMIYNYEDDRVMRASITSVIYSKLVTLFTRFRIKEWLDENY